MNLYLSLTARNKLVFDFGLISLPMLAVIETANRGIALNQYELVGRKSNI